MNLAYIISQVLVIIAYLVLGIGMRKEKRIHILICSNIYNFFLILSYILLGAISGTISCSSSFIRNFIFIYDEKKNKTTSKFVFIFFAIITIVLTAIFYKSPIDIFPCALTVITIFTVGSRNTKINRFRLFVCKCLLDYICNSI